MALNISEYITKNRYDELVNIQPNTILQHKNVMQNVFDKGIAFDKQINNRCVYEKIKKEIFCEVIRTELPLWEIKDIWYGECKIAFTSDDWKKKGICAQP